MSTVNFDQSFRATGGLQRFDCLAWVNFNGTGTVAIRASGNVSSITDNGTGDYTINFTNVLPDANYAVAGACGSAAPNASTFWGQYQTAPTVSACRVATGISSTAANTDFAYVYVAVFR